MRRGEERRGKARRGEESTSEERRGGEKARQGPHLEERPRSYQYFANVQGIPCVAQPQERRPGPWRGREKQGSDARPPSFGPSRLLWEEMCGGNNPCTVLYSSSLFAVWGPRSGIIILMSVRSPASTVTSFSGIHFHSPNSSLIRGSYFFT